MLHDTDDIKIFETRDYENAWKEAANVLGFELSQCCPKGYKMEGVQAFRDIKEAVKGKDIICTDSLPADIRGDFEHYQITKEIMDMANEIQQAIMIYCLMHERGTVTWGN